jgi:hypothetical protein
MPEIRLKRPRDPAQLAKLMIRYRSIIEEPYSSIARPFLRILVFWLMVIFACFGLRAPASPIVLIVIALSAISLSSTIFIILDMDMPYENFQPDHAYCAE